MWTIVVRINCIWWCLLDRFLDNVRECQGCIRFFWDVFLVDGLLTSLGYQIFVLRIKRLIFAMDIILCHIFKVLECNHNCSNVIKRLGHDTVM